MLARHIQQEIKRVHEGLEIVGLLEEPPLHFHEIAVSRDARGNYYCSFVYDDAEQVDNQDTPHKQQAKRKAHPLRPDGIVAFDLGIKTLATGVTDQGRFYHIGGFKGYRWYNKQLDKIRSKRDLCKRQMVIKKQEHETPKERNKRRIRNRMVYNDWGLYSFVQMLVYKCLRFGKELSIIDERDTTKLCHVCKQMHDMPLWQRTYRCPNCGLVMDRDENSAVNIYQRFVARLGPHT